MSDFNSFLINENNNLKAQVSEELRKISFVLISLKTHLFIGYTISKMVP